MQLPLLIASLLALFSGPLLWWLTLHERARPPRKLASRMLDLLVLASITGLILLEVLPGAAADAGWRQVLPWFAFGLALPVLLEHGFRRLARQMHLLTLAIGLLGLTLHAVVDGALIDDVAHGHGLSLAVVLHRIPVGLALWWLIYPALGLGWALATLSLVGVATVAGFSAHVHVSQLRDLTAMPWLQATIAGLILHVLYTRPHLNHGPHAPARDATGEPREPEPSRSEP